MVVMLLNWRAHLYRSLHAPDDQDRFSVRINFFLGLMVVLNIVEVVWFSIPAVSDEYLDLGRNSAIAFVIIFGVEYLLRVWSAVDEPYSDESEWTKRWRYIRSPMGMIDLLSFAPSLFLLVLPADIFGDLRILKLISIIRVIKLTRYSDSLAMLARLYRDNHTTLIAAAMVMLILSFMAATGIYVFERGAQPEAFGSIPACMWWAFVTLTTVGYGDMAPITLGGRMFGTLVMISGVGVAAIPAGIFASSFVQLIREQDRQKRRMRRQKNIQDSAVAASEVSTSSLKLQLSRSELREVDYLMEEYALSMDQAIAVVLHFRH